MCGCPRGEGAVVWRHGREVCRVVLLLLVVALVLAGPLVSAPSSGDAKVRVGLATVYRTLQLLKDNGLIAEHRFGDRCRRYEQAQTSHHDHLICLGCGAVIEFQEPLIERLQEKAARRHGFSAEHHRLELYGYCRACARERRR